MYGIYTGAIRVATTTMNVWMYVIGRLEKAIHDCETGCTKEDNCNVNETFVQTHSWDEAAAYYVGSIPKFTGQGGHLLYSLAENTCTAFGTCLTSGAQAGQALANNRILKALRDGQFHLHAQRCGQAYVNLQIIRTYMKIPLVQNVLRYAYKLGVLNDTRDETMAEGAAFAATILPLVHDCNPDDAAIIFDNMNMGMGSPSNGNTTSRSRSALDFVAVKQALERNYYCMGWSCDDVGGLVDAFDGAYLGGAEPCVDNAALPDLDESSASATPTALAIPGANLNYSVYRMTDVEDLIVP